MGRARVFIDPDTDEFARKHRWTDDLLIKVADEVERGLNDGPLGSSVFKRRVARDGAGSAGGYRVVVVIRVGDKAFIVEAFAKNVKQTHTLQEVRALRALAGKLLTMSNEALGLAVRAGDLRELKRRYENDENEEV